MARLLLQTVLVVGLGVLALLLYSQPAEAERIDVTFVSATPGVALDVAVSDYYAYIASYSGLLVVNISNPNAPSQVAFLPLPGDYVLGVALSGNYAYLINEKGKLIVVNISDPTKPTYTDEYDTSESLAYDLTVAGDYVYVAAHSDGLVVVNVSDPTNPTYAGGYDTSGSPHGVAVMDDYAYVADLSSGLVVVNVSNPVNPTYAGGYNTDYAKGVAVAGDYAFVADGEGGLVVVDVSDPVDPTYAGGYDTDNAQGVTVAGDYAYVADLGGGLVVVNVSNPMNPTYAGGYDTTGGAWSIGVSGDYAYTADYRKGLVVIDISNPTDPTWAGGLDTSDSAYDVAITGRFLYSVGIDGGLAIVNVSDPSEPSYVGGYSTSDWARGLTVVGDSAYIGVYQSGGLVIVNVSNQRETTLVGSYNASSAVLEVVVDGNYAYLANHENGLVVINVSKPSQPIYVGSYNTSGSVRDVVISDKYAYLADTNDGLVIVDISYPTDPSFTGSYDSYGRAYGVSLAGNYAYFTNRDGGLIVVDISNPADPSFVGEFDTAGDAIGVAVSGDYAYIADGASGLVVVDISDPSDPTYADGHDTSGYAYAVTVDGSYAYVACSEGGVMIFQINLFPTASIDSITPSPANEGDEVTFFGSGMDSDGSVTGYQWRSILDGNLSTDASFSTINLSSGDHTIFLKVQDDDGAWSTETSMSLHVNALPSAFIDSITPSWSNESEQITFNGSGSDSQGVIMGYQWNSSLDGLLSILSNFTVSNLSPGEHNISLKVHDDEGAWSSWVSTTLQINNVLPKAVIESVSPSPANEGEEVTFNGSASEPLGAITGHQWRSDIEGILSIEAYFSTDTLSPGDHTIYLKARDNEGTWSPEASTTLHINAIPSASIESITPSPANEGDRVTFVGSGIDQEESITAYEWNSSIDGLLNISASFFSSAFSTGNHTISFRVQDNLGAWSSWVSTTLHINSLPNALIDSITPNPTIAGTNISITGHGIDSDGEIVAYLWHSSIDGNLSDSASFSTNSLSVGEHIINFKVLDNNGTWSSEVSWVLTISTIVVNDKDNDETGIFGLSNKTTGSALLFIFLLAVGVITYLQLFKPYPANEGAIEPREGEESNPYCVEEIYLIYHDGRLITHLRAEETEMDEDIMSSMLTAIREFVKDSFKSEGYLGVIDHGDNKILLETGMHCYVAVVIYGESTAELRSRLKSTLHTIEVNLTGVLEDWDGNKEMLKSAKEAIIPILLSTASITREMVESWKEGRDVKLVSEWEFYQGYVRLKIAAANNTDMVITDVRLNLNYDEKVLRLDRIEPDYAMKGNEINFENLDGKSKKAVGLLFDPQICLKSVIDASLNFKTFRGDFITVAMKRRNVEVVCPLFFTIENANTAMLYRLINDELECQDNKIFQIPSGLSLLEAFEAAQKVMSGRDIQLVREFKQETPFQAEAWYYGVTKVKKLQLVMRVSVLETDNVIEIFAAASKPESMTGLLAELGADLQNRLQLLGRPTQQITNVTIKDSIIHRATMLFEAGEHDIKVEDSIISRSKIGPKDKNEETPEEE